MVSLVEDDARRRWTLVAHGCSAQLEREKETHVGVWQSRALEEHTARYGKQ
jgi:hypothetical protein